MRSLSITNRSRGREAASRASPARLPPCAWQGITARLPASRENEGIPGRGSEETRQEGRQAGQEGRPGEEAGSRQEGRQARSQEAGRGKKARAGEEGRSGREGGRRQEGRRRE